MIDLEKIPGMVEKIERQTLFDLAKSIDVRERGPVVEFGTYFGLSTACIVNGLKVANPNTQDLPLVYAYDSFRTKTDSEFAGSIRKHAEESHTADLLQIEKDEVIFRKVFENNLQPAISSGSLVTCENEIKDARCTVDRISMMHVDAPKYYRDFRYLMFEFFPRLTTGGAIVYQDYFFPYSGSIIAAIQHMAELHLIRPIKSAASSLIVEVIAPIKKSDMEHIDETMQSSFHPDAIDRAISSIESIPIDRPRVFLPRLYLSKLPYYWQSERFKDAQLCVANAIALQNQSTKFTPATNDVIHMLGNGFKPEFY